MNRHSARASAPVPAALRVVLRPAPLVSVVVGAAVLALAFRTAPFGIPLAVMLLSWTAKHSIATLHALAGGAREVPVLSIDMIFGTLGGWRSFLVMLLLVGLLFATGAASFWLGPVLAFAGAVVAASMLPAALVALGWTSSVAAAFDPRAWRRLAHALDRDFWILVAACVVVCAATVALFAAAHTQMIARIAVVDLGWLLLVALAGSTIHARRDALEAVTQFYRGREIEPSPELAARQYQADTDEIYALWRSGARSDAWQRVERLGAAAPSREHALRQLYARALTWDARPLAARIAQALIELDLAAGRSGYALKLARERIEIDAGFSAGDAAGTLALARLAVAISDWPFASALLAQFDQHTSDISLRDTAAALRQQVQAHSSSGS